MKEIYTTQVELVELDYRIVQSLQGALKKLDRRKLNKLQKSLKDKGRFMPEFVWYSSEDDTWYTLDGVSRLSLYKDIQFNYKGQIGYIIQFMKIEASDEKDAKEKLLLINSHYAEMTKQGLTDFVNGSGIDTKWMDITLDLSGFESFNFIEEANRINIAVSSDFNSFDFNNVNKTEEVSTQAQVLSDTPPEYSNPTSTNDKIVQPEPKVSDNDYTSYTEVLTTQDKKYILKIIQNVKKENNYSLNSEALMHVFNSFGEKLAL